MTARILALFIALLMLIDLFGDLLRPGFDAPMWWINFGAVLPGWLLKTLLAISAAGLVRFAFRKRLSWQRSRPLGLLAVALAMVALLNAIGFYRLLAAGRIDARFPLPLSLAVCGSLLWIGRSAWSEPRTGDRRQWWVVAGGGVCLFALFPLALMIFFGNTDYRRPADAAVVFGARVFPDGRISDALVDRIRTACELYRAGLVKRLVLSGGPGEGSVTEAEGMRTYALSHGVRSEDIYVDNQGLNTDATIRDTMPLFQQWHARRVLVVSHFYHLPRIKLAYQRAGINVYTVPAPQGHLLGKLPFYMAREVAAFLELLFEGEAHGARDTGVIRFSAKSPLRRAPKQLPRPVCRW